MRHHRTAFFILIVKYAYLQLKLFSSSQKKTSIQFLFCTLRIRLYTAIKKIELIIFIKLPRPRKVHSDGGGLARSVQTRLANKLICNIPHNILFAFIYAYALQYNCIQRILEITHALFFILNFITATLYRINKTVRYFVMINSAPYTFFYIVRVTRHFYILL